MEGPVKGKTFKMKGHTLPGIKQAKSDNLADGRSKSSALQQIMNPNPVMPQPGMTSGVTQRIPGSMAMKKKDSMLYQKETGVRGVSNVKDKLKKVGSKVKKKVKKALDKTLFYDITRSRKKKELKKPTKSEPKTITRDNKSEKLVGAYGRKEGKLKRKESIVRTEKSFGKGLYSRFKK